MVIGLEVGSLGVWVPASGRCFARASELAFGCGRLVHETWSLEDSGGDARHYKIGRGISLICAQGWKWWGCES